MVTYERIVDAKKVIKKICEESEALTGFDMVDDILYCVKTIMRDRNFPIKQKQAIITVLVCGELREDDGFLLPSTKECCEKFSSVKKAMKKHTLRLKVWDNIAEEYYTVRS